MCIDIIRSMFDSKMATLISCAGGANCQLCTVIHDELKVRELFIQGYQIYRHISDAIQLFGELTHEPISNINIVQASPLHSYTCISWWFNLLVYDLNVGN